jgi:S1-C subfamily serine protease
MTRQGVLVTKIIEGAAAQNIGIRPGDIVRQINGVNTNDISSFRHALVRARDFPRVQLLVQRRRTRYNVTLKP